MIGRICKICSVFVITLMSVFNSSNLAYAEESIGNEDEPIIDEVVGQPKYEYDEGAFNNVYYNVSMQASPTICWLQLQYGTNAQLRTEMTVYVGTFLGSWDQTIQRNGIGYSTEVYSMWNDGGTYVAAGVEGRAKISNTQVSYMNLSTYSL